MNLTKDKLHRLIEAAKRDYETALWWNNSKARYYTAVHAIPGLVGDAYGEALRLNAGCKLTAELRVSGEMQDTAKRIIQENMRAAGYRETAILAELALLDN